MEADIRGMRSDLLQRIDTQSETLTTRIDTQGEALTARIDTLSGNFNALHRLLVQIAAGGILTILVAILSLTLTRS